MKIKCLIAAMSLVFITSISAAAQTTVEGLTKQGTHPTGGPGTCTYSATITLTGEDLNYIIKILEGKLASPPPNTRITSEELSEWCRSIIEPGDYQNSSEVQAAATSLKQQKTP